MKFKWFAPIALLALIIPAIGAGPIAVVQSTPRDTTTLEATLADVNTSQAAYIAAADVTDAKRAAYDQALADLNQAITDESTARADLETKQQAYTDAYLAFPKEDSLRP